MTLSTRFSLLAVSALAVSTLTACASGSTPGSTSGSTDTVLNLALLGDIPTPDPDTAYDGTELNLVNNAYEGLLAYVPGQAEPELTGKLATEWSANEDNTVFTLKLREGVTFHDGTPFDSSAVQASFERRTEVGEGPSYMVAGVTDVKTPSEHEVVITLEAPNSSFLDLLASPFGPKMISPAALAEHPVTAKGEDWFDTNEAGTGPYTYGTFEQGVSYELDAYEDYWGEKPGYEKVRFDVISSMSTIQLKLENDELDGLIGYTDAPTFAAMSEDEGLETYTYRTMQTPTLFVNPKSPSLSDQKTRTAFLGGIDFAAVTEAALGETGEPTTEVFPQGLVPSELNQQQIPADPGALERLAEGALDGRTIRIAYPESTPAAKALSDNLAAVLNTAGIRAESVGFAAGTYYSALEKGADAPDLTFFTGYPDTAHPDAWGFVFYTPSGGLDLFGADVPGLADTLGTAVETYDVDAYAKAASMVSRSGYWYSVGTMLGTVVAQPEVEGVDEATHPVVTGVLELNLLHPAE